LHDGEKIELGERELEIVMTPGHTPDSLCVLDRGRRLLLTGDTFYPGNLWLYVPETNLDAYEKSMERISKLAAQVDHLLPAHNFPDADPVLLGRVYEALQKVKSGDAKFVLNRDGRRLYRFEGFSMLLPGGLAP
jgi:glyoxylase-like metal-dependent hydrolase (beta-lactamase superfamily II)